MLGLPRSDAHHRVADRGGGIDLPSHGSASEQPDFALAQVPRMVGWQRQYPRSRWTGSHDARRHGGNRDDHLGIVPARSQNPRVCRHQAVRSNSVRLVRRYCTRSCAGDLDRRNCARWSTARARFNSSNHARVERSGR